MPDLAIYSARPTVRLSGAPSDRVSELLLAMEIREQEGGMSSLELRLSNVASNTQGSSDLAFEDEKVLKLGTPIEVYAGDDTQPQEVFRGVVTGFEATFGTTAPPELVVFAEDKLQMARMKRRSAIYENQSVADIAREIANNLSLQPVITGFTSQLPVEVQMNESDLAFLRRIVQRYDGDVQVVGSELHISPRADVQRGTLTLSLYIELMQVRVMADLSHQVTQVTAAGWDPKTGEQVTATATGRNLRPGAGRTGASVLSSALGDRSEHVAHFAVATTEEAQAVANAAFDRRARQFVRVEATATGNPALRVGTTVTLTGLSGRFDNSYYVTFACHRFDVQRGYETDFHAECAYLAEK